MLSALSAITNKSKNLLPLLQKIGAAESADNKSANFADLFFRPLKDEQSLPCEHFSLPEGFVNLGILLPPAPDKTILPVADQHNEDDNEEIPSNDEIVMQAFSGAGPVFSQNENGPDGDLMPSRKDDAEAPNALISPMETFHADSLPKASTASGPDSIDPGGAVPDLADSKSGGTPVSEEEIGAPLAQQEIAPKSPHAEIVVNSSFNDSLTLAKPEDLRPNAKEAPSLLMGPPGQEGAAIVPSSEDVDETSVSLKGASDEKLFSSPDMQGEENAPTQGEASRADMETPLRPMAHEYPANLGAAESSSDGKDEGTPFSSPDLQGEDKTPVYDGVNLSAADSEELYSSSAVDDSPIHFAVGPDEGPDAVLITGGETQNIDRAGRAGPLSSPFVRPDDEPAPLGAGTSVGVSEKQDRLAGEAGPFYVLEPNGAEDRVRAAANATNPDIISRELPDISTQDRDGIISNTLSLSDLPYLRSKIASNIQPAEDGTQLKQDGKLPAPRFGAHSRRAAPLSVRNTAYGRSSIGLAANLNSIKINNDSESLNQDDSADETIKSENEHNADLRAEKVFEGRDVSPAAKSLKHSASSTKSGPATALHSGKVGREPEDSFPLRNQTDLSRHIWSPSNTGIDRNLTADQLLKGVPLRALGDGIFEEGLQHAVRFIRSEGRPAADIIIDPPALGRVEIELTSTAKGIEASIKVGSEQIRQIVQDNITLLRNNLEQQGVHLGEFIVDIRDDPGENPERRFSTRDERRRGSRRSETAANPDREAILFRLDLEQGILSLLA